MRWFLGRRGDMVWNAIILITVFLPLASMAIDIPRYYVLRSRMQMAADAAAEAAARCIDVRTFRETGDVRLNMRCAHANVYYHYGVATRPLFAAGYRTVVDNFTVDERSDTITVTARGNTRIFFNLSPEITIQVTGRARFRMR